MPLTQEVIRREKEEDPETGRERSRPEELRLLLEPLLYDTILRVLHRKPMIEGTKKISHLPHIDRALRRVEGEAAIHDLAIEFALAIQPQGQAPGDFGRFMNVVHIRL